MWRILHNIRSVAHYESKLLLRTWFFKIFGIGALIYILVQNFSMLTDMGRATWMFRSIPATIPYMTLLRLNIAQAVIAVFLSSEFIKRDKQLDTSEVFYVRPLSNAEYVLGKTWGNLRVFLALNVLVLLVTILFNLTASQSHVDLGSYFIYFLIISVPTLIFIMGLSFFTMLLLKNQALTFIVLLGYIAYTIIYVRNKYDGLFDYMANTLPLFRSTVVGFADAQLIFRLRGLYLLAGIAFICLTVVLFMRLPASRRERPAWLAIAVCCLLGVGILTTTHLHRISARKELRKAMIVENDTYGDRSVLVVHDYRIDLEQQPSTISVDASLMASPQTADRSFVFCLNPGLEVTRMAAEGYDVTFERHHQILLVDFGRTVTEQDTVILDISYNGALNGDACYLDAADRTYYAGRTNRNISIPKRYLFQTPGYALFTPESYWYPRSGTSFTQQHTLWQQAYFSFFDLSVKPLDGLYPVSQGALVDTTGGWFTYEPEVKLPSLTLSIGDYEYVSVDTADVTYGVYYLKGHDFFKEGIDSARYMIPGLLADRLEMFERNNQLPYRYFRFTIVEVPAPLTSYRRNWTTATEMTQPEMALLPEMGFGLNNVDFVTDVKLRRRTSRTTLAAEEYERQALLNFFNTFTGGNGNYSQYPQLFDFVYNVYSPKVPLANRLISIYFSLRRNNNATGYATQNGGMTVEERASLLLQDQSLAEIVADTSRSNMINNVIQLKAEQLFAYGESEIGRDSFYLYLSNIVKAYPFQNQRLEDVFAQLEDSTGVRMADRVDRWYHAKGAPRYLFTNPTVRRIRDGNMGYYEVKQYVTNDSDEEGLVMLVMQYGRGDNDYYPVVMPPQSTKEAIFVSELRPTSLVVRTMLSQNLPGRIETQLSTVDWGRLIRDEAGETRIVDAERPTSYTEEGEIIVDNEDTLLFSITQPELEQSRLSRWLHREQTSDYRYGTFAPFRPPVEWRAVVNNNFYGQFARSGYVVRTTGYGGVKQSATWKVYVDEPGTYDVFCNMWRADNAFLQQQGRMRQPVFYRFQVTQGKRVNVPFQVDYRRVQSGWTQLGTLVLERDTAFVTLFNDAELRYVAADAVKFVRK
ncbi:MAG: hypothetical protein IKI72_01300 [Bacteroidales bacterium]|nr:hypothetical protein [Bacteroidales bacterium]